jgi:drug/metabolite transporter (DMT)-like permease
MHRIRGQLRHQWLSPGIGFAIAAPLSYSISIPLSKVFLQTVDPWLLAGWMDLATGIGMAAVYGGRALWHTPKNPLRGRDWNWMWGSIVAGGVIAPVLQSFGIAYSTAATASLLLNLEGVFTSLIAWIVFREVFNRSIAYGLSFITAGSVLLVWTNPASVSVSLGSLAVVGASLAWATTSNFTHKVSHCDPVQVVLVKTVVSGGVNVAIALALGSTLPPLPLLATISFASFLCIGSTFICFILALRHIGTSRAGTFFALFPFTGAIFSIVLLKEPLTLNLLGAALLMAIGLGFCFHKNQPIAPTLPD